MVYDQACCLQISVQRVVPALLLLRQPPHAANCLWITIVYWNLTLDPFAVKYFILLILNNSDLIVSDSKDVYFGPELF